MRPRISCEISKSTRIAPSSCEWGDGTREKSIETVTRRAAVDSRAQMPHLVEEEFDLARGRRPAAQGRHEVRRREQRHEHERRGRRERQARALAARDLGLGRRDLAVGHALLGGHLDIDRAGLDGRELLHALLILAWIPLAADLGCCFFGGILMSEQAFV